ncbi:MULTISPECIES: rhamnulose-1-phosphate aldolase [Paenibacillus]|jgi:rhamnulose-1-phosphate aldolase|uniref:Rhamnulose-1-phosphate aldolase n=1 Tax=Paenibacillus odorifer TaxID=189426 RepID=A0A1R0Z6E3_9BACL|nr:MULTISPECIES: rhamnulose-1-phosphate aldolase [Paenibacillus]AIQ74874.1 rhamnulose-1-phosphate aldolase [Paenibacillus odorifer]AWV34193.1 rhamnulose-1-phosphate aldolase [Paenibacillus odorifer]ETT46338.1 rhamnulose-1-phosphate aldolase [Paenibacillus sp. FSL H8-237]MDH6428371.1 rhamnulose-1-phosphate aldolase [Paenibacillus sp. PastH-4]MDH6443996.1 rhamnulose-1-phosphate aldolase [Paenibacillus sp. PastF-4]
MSTSLLESKGYIASSEAPFIQEMSEITRHMWELGWDELNGGNVSYLLDENEVAKYINVLEPLRTIKLTFPVKELAGKYFIVTGSGKYFRNVIKDPEANLGVLRVSGNGESVEVLWGLRNGAVPTSELASHFMSHIERLKVDPTHRIVLHTHATNVIAMTFTHDLDELKFTKTLWEMCTECLVVFPDGVSVIPWIVPGSSEIGRETAKKMKDHRLVIWPQHGIFGTGSTMDATFGLVETVEKAATIYNLIGGREIKQKITDQQLWDLAKAFGVTPKAGILEV